MSATPLPESDLRGNIPFSRVVLSMRVTAPAVAAPAAFVTIYLMLAPIAIDHLRRFMHARMFVSMIVRYSKCISGRQII